ncbi:T9SS type A sorting domain-containing protein [Flavobacterium sp. LS1R47]|uniref:T9SS type A sorting domain-containing protein n=1 Tax=Flavobacterium frigoritolerans TaxID=2987686 RepID=A0A9X3BZV2_9FLAO|nr:T9SS type A sorting domain-containing protein [Flavobacterium frigoritolerans]MCV9930805.1 T9SS type A sorting domain-containing protein [Flavobacterium frigoritolerans]
MKTKLLLFLLMFAIAKIDAQQLIYDFSGGSLGFVEFNNNIFFNAAKGDFGAEIWQTDGTTSNTTLLKDINQGKESSYFSSLKRSSAILNNKLYFIAKDGSSDGEIWKTDGTENGTTKVTNFINGRTLKLTSVGNYIYFLIRTTNDPLGSTLQVWKTNGTEGGTELVKDNLPIINTHSFEGECNNTFMFSFSSPGNTSYTRVWRSDGTSEGTFPITDNLDGNGTDWSTSTLSQYINYNNKLYFVSRYFLHETDGTLENTKKVGSLYVPSTTLVMHSDVIEANNNLYFMFFLNDSKSLSIWKFDPKNKNISIAYDNKYATQFFSPSNLSKTDNSLLFCSSNETEGGASLVSLNLSNNVVTEIKKFSDANVEKPLIFRKDFHAYTISKINSDEYFVVSGGDKDFKRKGWISNVVSHNTENISLLDDVTNAIAYNDYLYYSKDNKLWKYANNLNTELIESKASLILYPNPSYDFIQINSSNEDEIKGIRVFDLNGRLVINLSSNNNNKIDVSKLSQGTYIVEFKFNGTLVSKKIVKK